jgi:phosphoglycerol transferase
MQNPKLLMAALVCMALVACGERTEVAPKSAATPAPVAVTPAQPASLADGIVFSKATLPDFVAKTEGIAQAEPFGRWTDGAKAVVEFKEPLPRKFDLVVEAAAFGPNAGQPVKVTIGAVTQDLVFANDMPKGTETKRLAFSLDQPANRIELAIPRPTRPPGNDVRELGIALVSLKIDAAGK